MYMTCVIRVLCCLLLALGLGDVHSAVIEVTAGGGTAPTYQFSGDSAEQLANFTANADGSIAASGILHVTDLVTGSNNRVDDLATRLAAAEAIATLQGQVAQLTPSPQLPPSSPPPPLSWYDLGRSGCAANTGGIASYGGDNPATNTIQGCAETCASTSGCVSFAFRNNNKCALYAYIFCDGNSNYIYYAFN